MDPEGSQLLEEDEINLFAWVLNDFNEEKLKNLLAGLSKTQRRQLFYMTKIGEKNVLHCAAESGCSTNLQLLIDSAFDLLCMDKLDNKCKNGMTPLHYAAKSHQTACVKMLVQAGANVNALNVARNTPLHLACLNFPAYYLPSLNARSYSTIKYLASQPDTHLGVLNMDGKTPLSISPNYWIQHLEWDRDLRGKLDEYKLQVAQSQTLVTEWKYFCNNKPVQQLTEITCPRLAGFELYDCKLLTGCFYDDDCVQHVVSVKVVDADNDAHMREIAVLNMLRGELTDSAKRALNINLGNTTGTVEYLVFSYVALDLNSFLHAKSDIVVGLVHQAVCALAAVHSAHVMHGDIKPHNFSVRVHQHSHFRVVLGNFDHAVLLGEKPHGRSVPAYYPPETEYLKYEHPWVSPEVYHSLQQRQQQQQERHEAEASASLAGDEAGAQQQQQRMHWKDQNKKTRIAVEASLAIDVFSLGLIVGVAVDNECCRDRGKRMYERRDLPRVMASQMDLTMQFRAARCRSDPLAKKLLVCATNMMCLLDPLQRCKIDDILREIEL